MPRAMEVSLSTTTEVNACAAQCMKHSSLKKIKIINSIYCMCLFIKKTQNILVTLCMLYVTRILDVDTSQSNFLLLIRKLSVYCVCFFNINLVR